MDDPILARAKLLVNLANGLPNFPAASREDRPSKAEQKRATPLEVQPSLNLPAGSFLVSVIRGSSLLSTTEDLRLHLRKGSSVLIDGVEYSVSSRKTAEWSPTRIELASDYDGASNLYATLQVKDWVPKKSPQKRSNSIEPVASSDIREAIRALDEINPISRQRIHPEIKSTAIIPQKVAMRRARTSDTASRTGKSGETTAAPYDSFTSLVDGSYLAGLLERRGENDARLEEQRRQAMLRVAQKKKQDELAREQKRKEEEHAKATIRLNMDCKARELRERTLKRVSGIKKAKSDEERARLDVREEELKRKEESNTLVKSEEYKLRMQQLRLESKQKMQLMQKSKEDFKRKEDLLMKKQLSEISEQRRRHDVGPIKRTSMQKYEDSLEIDRPMTEGKFSVESEMSNDLGYAENEEEAESDDNYINADYRAALQFKKSRPPPHPEQRYRTEGPIAVPSPLGGTGIRYNPSTTSKTPPPPRADDDDDDDDGYWSNDSLGDDVNVTFNEPPESLVYRSPPQRAQPIVHQSYDSSDDMTTLSAITLGSPQHLASSNRIPPQQQPRQRSTIFKPLKPLPVRPFVPVPTGK